MSKPAIPIHVDPVTAQALSDHAASLGLTVQEYLKRLFPATNGAGPVDDVDRWLDDLCEGLPALPSLPRDFSTKDVYADHD